MAYEPGQQTVALMFRLALAAEAEELNRCQSDDFHQVAGHVALELQKALDQRKLHLPSLAEVIEVEHEIAQTTKTLISSHNSEV